jgi:hypothetical protein
MNEPRNLNQELTGALSDWYAAYAKFMSVPSAGKAEEIISEVAWRAGKTTGRAYGWVWMVKENFRLGFDQWREVK